MALKIVNKHTLHRTWTGKCPARPTFSPYMLSILHSIFVCMGHNSKSLQHDVHAKKHMQHTRTCTHAHAHTHTHTCTHTHVHTHTRTCTHVHTSHNCELGQVILCNGSLPFGFRLELQGKTIIAGRHNIPSHSTPRIQQTTPSGHIRTHNILPNPKYDNCCWATTSSEEDEKPREDWCCKWLRLCCLCWESAYRNTLCWSTNIL